jgi:hypothetical protein
VGATFGVDVLGAGPAELLRSVVKGEGDRGRTAMSKGMKLQVVCHPHAAQKTRGAAKNGAALPSVTPTDTTTERPGTVQGLGLTRLPGNVDPVPP